LGDGVRRGEDGCLVQQGIDAHGRRPDPFIWTEERTPSADDEQSGRKRKRLRTEVHKNNNNDWESKRERITDEQARTTVLNIQAGPETLICWKARKDEPTSPLVELNSARDVDGRRGGLPLTTHSCYREELCEDAKSGDALAACPTKKSSTFASYAGAQLVLDPGLARDEDGDCIPEELQLEMGIDIQQRVYIEGGAIGRGTTVVPISAAADTATNLQLEGNVYIYNTVTTFKIGLGEVYQSDKLVIQMMESTDTL